MDFIAIKPTLKSGEEKFTDGETQLPYQLIDFWRWSVSDLLSNTMRGILAEFIVAVALGCKIDTPRIEWNAFDLITPDNIKVEVKSSAYLQSWHNGKLSRPSFDIHPTQLLAPDGTIEDASFKRRAHVYVFCLFNHQEMKTANPLDLSQWEFFVVSSKRLDQGKKTQKYINLNSLRRFCGKSVTALEIDAEINLLMQNELIRL